MKTTYEIVSSLTVLCVFVLPNDACAENGLFENINMKSANKDIKPKPNYRRETIALDNINNKRDNRYREVELSRTLIKPASFGKLDSAQNNIDIFDNIQDINAGKQLKIFEAINDGAYPIKNDYDQLRDVKDLSDINTITDGNALTTSWDKKKDSKDILYVETTNGGDGMAGGSNVEELVFNNTTLPPMICWEMNCSDCVAQESEIRCFVRSSLTVMVRFAIFGMVIIFLFACVYISTKEKKCKNAGIKRTGKEVVDRGDKTALIDPA